MYTYTQTHTQIMKIWPTFLSIYLSIYLSLSLSLSLCLSIYLSIYMSYVKNKYFLSSNSVTLKPDCLCYKFVCTLSLCESFSLCLSSPSQVLVRYCFNCTILYPHADSHTVHRLSPQPTPSVHFSLSFSSLFPWMLPNSSLHLKAKCKSFQWTS